MLSYIYLMSALSDEFVLIVKRHFVVKCCICLSRWKFLLLPSAVVYHNQLTLISYAIFGASTTPLYFTLVNYLLFLQRFFSDVCPPKLLKLFCMM